MTECAWRARQPNVVVPCMRGIQYAAASRFPITVSGMLDRPVKPGDDDRGCDASMRNPTMIPPPSPL